MKVNGCVVERTFSDITLTARAAKLNMLERLVATTVAGKTMHRAVFACWSTETARLRLGPWCILPRVV